VATPRDLLSNSSDGRTEESRAQSEDSMTRQNRYIPSRRNTGAECGGVLL
jgi:hypothetical protein